VRWNRGSPPGPPPSTQRQKGTEGRAEAVRGRAAAAAVCAPWVLVSSQGFPVLRTSSASASADALAPEVPRRPHPCGTHSDAWGQLQSAGDGSESRRTGAHTDRGTHGQGNTRTGAHTGGGTQGQGHTRTGAHTDGGTHRQGHTRTGAHTGRGTHGQGHTQTGAHTDGHIRMKWGREKARGMSSSLL